MNLPYYRVMDPRLNTAFNKLQHRKIDLLKRLEVINQQDLQIHEAPDKWSVTQVLVHLLETERSSLMYCRKKIQAADDLPGMSWISKIRLLGLWLFLRLPIKIKTSAAFSNPSNEHTLSQIRNQWSDLANEEVEFLEDYPKRYLQKTIFRHPIAGRIKVLDMILFFEGHIAHHEHQIDRILKSLVKESSG